MLKKSLQFFAIFVLFGALWKQYDANALMWNDANVVPVQSISDHRWRDGNTGRLINVAGMPGITPTTPAAPTTTPTTPPAPAPTGGGTTPTAPGGTTTTAKGWKGMSKGAKVGAALGAVGAVAGTVGVIDSASGDTEHTWGNVLEGTLSGATAAAGGAAVINAIPGIGQIGYGVAIAGGAIVGGAISGSQLFSETDCLNDPATGLFTCCHTQFNQGQRYADIGDYMFCVVENDGVKSYGVRQCLQGGDATKSSWWDGLWKDDFWQPECVYRYCGGDQNGPLAGIDNYITHTPDIENFCWNWDCISGYTKSGNTCTSNGTNIPVSPVVSNNPYDIAIKNIQVERQRIMRMCGSANAGGIY